MSLLSKSRGGKDVLHLLQKKFFEGFAAPVEVQAVQTALVKERIFHIESHAFGS